MSDSLLDLGTASLWDLQYEWREAPSSDFDSSVVTMGSVGTRVRMADLSEELPEKLESTVKNANKLQEYDLIDQFVFLQGQYARFWLPAPVNHFYLKGTHGAGSGSLTIYYAGYQYKADRRLFVLLKDGSRITRKITAVADDEANDEQVITINNNITELISPDNVRRFCLLYLARLEVDNLEMKHHSLGVSETKLKAIELVQEYSEV